MSETKPPDENGSWLRWAIAQIDFTDLIAVASSPEPLTGLQVANACIEELKAHEAKAAKYDELKKAERELSEAYMHIRHIVDAFDTKPGGTDRFELTERKVAEAVARAAAYDEAMRRLNDIEGQHDRECPWSSFDACDPDLGLKLNGKWYKPGEEPVCECPVGKAERFIEAEIAAGRFQP